MKHFSSVDEMSEAIESTGFYDGAPCTDPAEIRAYFTRENMRAMFGGHCEIPDQKALDEMAEYVIRNNRWAPPALKGN